ncbi:MAG: NAD(P)-binding domain-containing protein, partial [Rickettsiales bacterium]
MARVGFVGVGLMGHGMAANLMAKGNELTVIGHRNRVPVEDLVSRGAAEAETLQSLCEASDILFFCLSDSSVVEQVVADLRPRLRDGQIIVDTTTANPVSTKRLHAAL